MSIADEFSVDAPTDAAGPVARPYVPPSCDLFIITPEKGAELEEKGVSPYLDRLCIARIVNATQKEWIRMPGTQTTAFFPAPGASKAWLSSEFGPGTYFVQGRNVNHQIIGQFRFDLGMAPGYAPPMFLHPSSPGANVGNGGGWQRGHAPTWPQGSQGFAPAPAQGFYPPAPALPTQSTPEQQFMFRLLDRWNQSAPAPVAPAPDPVLTAALAKLTDVVSALAARASAPAPEPRASIADTLLPTLITGLLEQKKNPEPAAKPQTVQETIALLALGAKLFNKTGKDKDSSEWIAMIPELADSVGVPLVAAVAQAIFPKDKADAVLEAIRVHMETRKAEAEADKATAGDVIDTEGVPVK